MEPTATGQAKQVRGDPAYRRKNYSNEEIMTADRRTLFGISSIVSDHCS